MLSAKTNGVISSSTDSMEPLAQRVVFILLKKAGIAGVANELHAQIPPLFATFHGVGKAADFHALGIGFGNDLLDGRHHLRMVDFAHMTQRGGQVFKDH